MKRMRYKKIAGLKNHVPSLKLAAARVLQRDVSKVVFKYLYGLLNANRNADGTPRPSTNPQGAKKASTIKAYERAGQGWDTKHYLVRTGEATKLEAQLLRGGRTLRIKPKGQKVLGYHIPQSAHRGEIRWLELSEQAQQEIIETAKRELARVFR